MVDYVSHSRTLLFWLMCGGLGLLTLVSVFCGQLLRSGNLVLCCNQRFAQTFKLQGGASTSYEAERPANTLAGGAAVAPLAELELALMVAFHFELAGVCWGK